MSDNMREFTPEIKTKRTLRFEYMTVQGEVVLLAVFHGELKVKR